jgi:hypothetical protein
LHVNGSITQEFLLPSLGLVSNRLNGSGGLFLLLLYLFFCSLQQLWLIKKRVIKERWTPCGSLIFINSSRGAKKDCVCVCVCPGPFAIACLSRHGHILPPADIKSFSFSFFLFFRTLNLNILGIYRREKEKENDRDRQPRIKVNSLSRLEWKPLGLVWLSIFLSKRFSLFDFSISMHTHTHKPFPPIDFEGGLLIQVKERKKRWATCLIKTHLSSLGYSLNFWWLMSCNDFKSCGSADMPWALTFRGSRSCSRSCSQGSRMVLRLTG